MTSDHINEYRRSATLHAQLQQMVDRLQAQADVSERALSQHREREEAHARRALDKLFVLQQQRLLAAVRPAVSYAWMLLGGAAAIVLLTLLMWWVLMRQAAMQLHAAQVRAEAVELDADIQQAMQQVKLSNCGGQPCLRLDRNARRWKRGDEEYVLVVPPPPPRQRQR